MGRAFQSVVIWRLMCLLDLDCVRKKYQVGLEHYKSLNIATDISQINGFVGNKERIYDLMAQDKKVVNGVIRFILARDIGKTMVQENVSKDLIIEVLQDSLER